MAICEMQFELNKKEQIEFEAKKLEKKFDFKSSVKFDVTYSIPAYRARGKSCFINGAKTMYKLSLTTDSCLLGTVYLYTCFLKCNY